MPPLKKGMAGQVIKDFGNEQDKVCQNKEYTYFDHKNDSDSKGKVILNKYCYKTQKEALNWNTSISWLQGKILYWIYFVSHILCSLI